MQQARISEAFYRIQKCHLRFAGLQPHSFTCSPTLQPASLIANSFWRLTRSDLRCSSHLFVSICLQFLLWPDHFYVRKHENFRQVIYVENDILQTLNLIFLALSSPEFKIHSDHAALDSLGVVTHCLMTSIATDWQIKDSLDITLKLEPQQHAQLRAFWPQLSWGIPDKKPSFRAVPWGTAL
jgi:hypothetical protein